MDANRALCFRRASLVVATVLAGFFVSSQATSSPFGSAMFTGGGYGPTADVAIQSALWDAEASASYFQYSVCELVGDVMVFARANPRFGRSFTAQVTIACTA